MSVLIYYGKQTTPVDPVTSLLYSENHILASIVDMIYQLSVGLIHHSVTDLLTDLWVS